MRPLRTLRRLLKAGLRGAVAAIADPLGLGGPRVLRRTIDRTRRLQKRAGQLAYRAPFDQPHRPRLARGLEDRGFQ